MIIITNFFSKYDLHQSSTLQPFEDGLFMCTPPSSMRSFQHIVQSGQSLRFCDLFFKLFQEGCKVLKSFIRRQSACSIPTL